MADIYIFRKRMAWHVRAAIKKGRERSIADRDVLQNAFTTQSDWLVNKGHEDLSEQIHVVHPKRNKKAVPFLYLRNEQMIRRR